MGRNVNFVVDGHEMAQMKGIGEVNSYMQPISTSNQHWCSSLHIKDVIFDTKSSSFRYGGYFIDLAMESQKL